MFKNYGTRRLLSSFPDFHNFAVLCESSGLLKDLPKPFRHNAIVNNYFLVSISCMLSVTGNFDQLQGLTNLINSNLTQAIYNSRDAAMLMTFSFYWWRFLK